MALTTNDVPIVQLTDAASRYGELGEKFKALYGREPEFICRAPGRVNLIGEHIDYCGYSVLPMAIEQDIAIAAASNTDARFRIANTDSQYKSVEIETGDFEIDKTNPGWQHYALCGYRGAVNHLAKLRGATQHSGERGEEVSGESPPTKHSEGGDKGIEGLDLLLEGSVPRSAGLSSSSALVCCAALASLFARGVKQIDKVEIAEMCQHCERYIGTEGGGMDQSISFLAKKGTAKLIEFNPLRATDVALPDGAVFVVSNCCVESNKAATDYFNTRVAECRIATQILAKLNELDVANMKRLCDVQKSLNLSLEECVSLVKKTFHEEAYTRSEICQLLSITEQQLHDNLLTERSRKVELFKLRQRAEHVYSEADRVLKFKAVCDLAFQTFAESSSSFQELSVATSSSDEPQTLASSNCQEPTATSSCLEPTVAATSSCPELSAASLATLRQLGALMYSSHVSCRDLYECSCAELDELVELAMASGALGSRLTGAGWGGCAVSLVPAGLVDGFVEKIRAGFYEKRGISGDLSQCLFSTEPGSGAAVFTLV